MNYVQEKVTRAHNKELIKPFEMKEVKRVVFYIHPIKSPEEDGLNLGFYKRDVGVLLKRL